MDFNPEIYDFEDDLDDFDFVETERLTRDLTPKETEYFSFGVKSLVKSPVQKEDVFKTKKIEQLKKIEAELKKLEPLQFEESEIINSYLANHEKNMILEEMKKIDYRISYDNFFLNFAVLFNADKNKIENVLNYIELRNKQKYLEFETNQLPIQKRHFSKKEATQLLKKSRKLRKKMNGLANKNKTIQHIVDKDSIQFLRKSSENKKHCFFVNKETFFTAFSELLERLFNIKSCYYKEIEQFIISGKEKTFIINVNVSVSRELGRASGLAEYTSDDTVRNIHLIREIKDEKLIYKELETLSHEIGHCIDGFSQNYPEEFEVFNEFDLLANTPTLSQQEIISVFFEYILLDKIFLKNIDFNIKDIESLLVGNYYSVMIDSCLVETFFKGVLRKSNTIRKNVKNNNFGYPYINYFGIYSLMNFHENYREFSMIDYYFLGHYHALKSIKKHFPEIHSYFK